MSLCDPVLTSRLIDGELDDATRVEAEAHVSQCPDCQALISAAEGARALLRGPAAQLTAPPELRQRVRASLESDTSAARRRGGMHFWQGAVSGVAASLLAASLAAVMLTPPPAERLVASLADAHATALMSGHPISVVSSSRHTVRPWFAGRAPVAPPAPDLAAQGFPLAGGRTQWVGGREMAVVVYRHGAHEIDLYVWPLAAGKLPAEGEGRGYKLLFWSVGDLAFAAVSDVDPTELRRFAGLVRGARE